MNIIQHAMTAIKRFLMNLRDHAHTQSSFFAFLFSLASHVKEANSILFECCWCFNSDVKDINLHVCNGPPFRFSTFCDCLFGEGGGGFALKKMNDLLFSA